MFELPVRSDYLGIIGDTHGNTRWLRSVLDFLHEEAQVTDAVVLGDFGVWHGEWGTKFLDGVQGKLRDLNMNLWVVLGNHENYDLVETIEPDEDGLQWIRPRIALFPRVFRFGIKGVSYLALGGAPSIDFQFRKQGSSWWPQEMITEEDVEAAIAGGHAQVMFTHDAPENGTPATNDIITKNPMGWSRKALDYAKIGRDRMTKVVQAVKPDLMMHGHYHVYSEGHLYFDDGSYPGRIISFNPDGMPKNFGVLHLNDISEVNIVG